MKNNSALTLIELLVVIALLGIISIPLYLSYTNGQANQSLTASASQLADSFKSAHVFSREAKDQKQWGVRRKDIKTYELIAGTTQSFTAQKTFRLETFVSIPNDFLIWFDIGTGATATAQSVIVKNDFGRVIKINISRTGVVNVEQNL